MTIVATSLKLPAKLKARIAAAARTAGLSTHAFMLSALAEKVDDSERARRFLAEAVAADRAMQKSGLGYDVGDVHSYLGARAQGRKVDRPHAKPWRG